MNITDSNVRLTRAQSRHRKPAVAGMFYPSDRTELSQMVSRYTDVQARYSEQPRMLIVPHAGYIYSGAVAGTAYASLKNHRGSVKKVILFGPAHRTYIKGLALPDADYLATPLGDIPIDQSLAKQVMKFPQVSISNDAHMLEHSLEVQLPFLQLVLDCFSILPLVVGSASIQEIMEILDSLGDMEEALIVISSDLSHYHEYEVAQQIDAETSTAITSCNLAAIGHHQACGFVALQGALQFARDRGMWVVELDRRNSGDTAGPRDRVVGYGAFAVYAERQYDNHQKRQLLDLARSSILKGMESKRPLEFDTYGIDPILLEKSAAFVTLKINGRLRGCIGTTSADDSLARTVSVNAFNAAYRDPRFAPLEPEEYEHIELSISVLTEPRVLKYSTESELLACLVPGKVGLIIELGPHRATFLPEVWKSLPRPLDFLQQLKIKAGISRDAMPEMAWSYRAVHLE